MAVSAHYRLRRYLHLSSAVSHSTFLLNLGYSPQIEVYIYPDVELQGDSSAPLWIIVVSVLAGVLLLALICLLLWKVT